MPPQQNAAVEETMPIEFFDGAKNISSQVRVVESRVVLQSISEMECTGNQAFRRHGGIEVKLSNGDKLWIDKNYSSDGSGTTVMKVTKIDKFDDNYHFRARPTKDGQISLKELYQQCEKQQSFDDHSNCQDTPIDLFNKTTNVHEVDIPQQFLLDLYRLQRKVFGERPLTIDITYELGKKCLKTLCNFPKVRAVAGITVSAFIVTCYRNKNKVLNDTMSISEFIDEAGKVILSSSLAATKNIVISSSVAGIGKQAYKFIDKNVERGTKFQHKACGTAIGALIRPIIRKILEGDSYGWDDATSDFTLESLTQYITYLIRQTYGVTTFSNCIVNVVFVIMPQLWQVIDQIRKGKSVSIDWWAFLTSLVTLALSFTTASWWVVWILTPFLIEMMRDIVMTLYDYYYDNDDVCK